ncbi:MAG: GIY-YIG nuclease family protein [Bacteroidia bacterium]|nr:GIY-YIG nuclease family protein [Bacteroidia bacterium]
MKHYTYILKSTLNGRHYYGSTCNLENRLKYHNSGKVKSTKAYKPWVIHYLEEYETKTEAIKREFYFKSIDGYNYLKTKGII